MTCIASAQSKQVPVDGKLQGVRFPLTICLAIELAGLASFRDVVERISAQDGQLNQQVKQSGMIPPTKGFNNSAIKDIIAFTLAIHILSDSGTFKDIQ